MEDIFILKNRRGGQSYGVHSERLLRDFIEYRGELPDFLMNYPKFTLIPSHYTWRRLIKIHLSKPTKNELEIL